MIKNAKHLSSSVVFRVIADIDVVRFLILPLWNDA